MSAPHIWLAISACDLVTAVDTRAVSDRRRAHGLPPRVQPCCAMRRPRRSPPSSLPDLLMQTSTACISLRAVES